MVKRKRGVKKTGTQLVRSSKELLDSNDFVPDEASPSYYNDEIDDFFAEKEKLLLKDDEYTVPKAYGQEEVLRLDDDSDSENDKEDDYHFDPDDDDGSVDADDKNSYTKKQEEDMASDIEDSDDDDLPDVRSWGKRKSTYYNTDYVDKGYKDYRESDAEAAEAEEKELLALEKRLTQEMQDSDFGLQWLEEKKPEKQKLEEKVKVDLKSLSKQAKLELLERTSPELLDFYNDFVAKLTELTENLQPVIEQIKENNISTGQWREYVLAKYQTILLYCMNISFFFVLKAKGIATTNHPVIKRILQFRKLLKDLDSVTINPSFSPVVSPVKPGMQPEPLASEEETIQEDFDDISENEDEVNETEESKRGITYAIAKNKGLTPYRKKELRNPRVKHRRKYERAKVRRKGQVREAITEIRKYGGEFSGIKMSVVKSTKF